MTIAHLSEPSPPRSGNTTGPPNVHRIHAGWWQSIFNKRWAGFSSRVRALGLPGAAAATLVVPAPRA